MTVGKKRCFVVLLVLVLVCLLVFLTVSFYRGERI
jgi:hypothetical protein